jgi:prepilin-type N-terminal cleavage/methylation domain-containing protein
MTRPASRRLRAFTLIELLVVIGIIVLLLAILLPVAGRVRVQAQSTRTAATMASIAGAIERYYQTEHAYPGLYTNSQLAAITPITPTVTFTPTATGAGTKITGTENMVQSLVGGIDPNAAGAPATVKLDATTTIGKGPLNFALAAQYRTRNQPYIDAGPILPTLPYQSTGCAATSLDTPGTAPGTKDSGFPEFYDNYSQPRPILYLRANVGAAGVSNKITDAGSTALNQQYSAIEFKFYMRGEAGVKGFPGDFTWGQPTPLNSPANPDYDYYGSEVEYLQNPNLPGTARGKDKYVLISAGADRVFGTKDDIFYGGN